MRAASTSEGTGTDCFITLSAGVEVPAANRPVTAPSKEFGIQGTYNRTRLHSFSQKEEKAHSGMTDSAFCFAASPQPLSPQQCTGELSDPLSFRISCSGLPAARARGVTRHRGSLAHTEARTRPAVQSRSPCSKSYSLRWLRRCLLNEWFSSSGRQDLAGVWVSLRTRLTQASSSSYQRGPVSTLLVRRFHQGFLKQA